MSGCTPRSALLVTRAKYAISFFNPFQGSPPAFPIPILLVAATINVRPRGLMLEPLSLKEVCSGLVVSSDIILSIENPPQDGICGKIQRETWDFKAKPYRSQAHENATNATDATLFLITNHVLKFFCLTLHISTHTFIHHESN